MKWEKYDDPYTVPSVKISSVTAQAAKNLSGCWRDHTQTVIAGFIAHGIIARSPLEIWRIDGKSFLATETIRPIVTVWAYQGVNALGMMRDLVRIARQNEMAKIRYPTIRKGFMRMFHEFSPKNIDGEWFEIEIKP